MSLIRSSFIVGQGRGGEEEESGGKGDGGGGLEGG